MSKTEKAKETLTLWVPDRFSARDCFQGNGERPVKQAYFAHLVTTKKPDENGFVRLKWSVLRKQTDNKSIQLARSFFEPHLDSSPHKIGVCSTGHRWNFDPAPTEVTYHAPRFKAKLEKYWERKRAEYSELEANLEGVLRNSSLDVADIKAEVAKLPDKDGTKNEAHRRFIIGLQLEQVKSGDFGLISRSSRTGRLHCLHNRIHSSFRERMLLNGEEVSELDLASSQPYFLSRMFSCPQLSRAVYDGSFYERVNDALACQRDLSDSVTYGAFKQAVLATIYVRPRHGFKYWLEGNGLASQIWLALGKVYPGLTDFIAGYSMKYGETALAVELQRRVAAKGVESLR